MRLNRLWLIGMLGPLLGGCFTYAPTDLRLSSIRLEDWRDRAPLWRDVQIEGLIVEFTSETDIAKFADDRLSSTVSAEIFFCDRRNRDILVGYPDVFVNDKVIPYSAPDPSVALAPPFTYQLLVAASWRYVNPPRVLFDLRQKPEDVCFRVSGGNMAGFGYKSNVVVIPKAAIEAALAPPIRLPD